MRWRLFLSFTAIIIITLGSLAYNIRKNALEEVNTFAERGGFMGLDNVVTDLEDIYEMDGHWNNAEQALTITTPGKGTGVRRGPNAEEQDTQEGQGMMMGNNQPEDMMGAGHSSMMFVTLADSNGNILIDPDDPENTGSLTSEELANSIPLQHNDQVVGYLLPAWDITPPNRDKEISTSLSNRLNDAVFQSALIAGGLALILALLLGYFLLRPVRQLTLAATNMTEGDLSQRVSIKGSGELVTLGNTFNQMAFSLEEAEKKRQAMTADIAHELRTPLAVQRANLEAMQDGVYPLSQENLAAILEQNRLLIRLVEDLRTIALSDSDELHLFLQSTDLRDLVQKTVEQFQPQAETQEIQLQHQLTPEPIMVNIDISRIEQVLNNLIHNGLRHAPTGGNITLTLSGSENTAELSVHDNGQGIDPQALPHIFERFYRADQSRARDQGGSGLGLTIARRMAEAHQGSLTAKNHPNGGAVFTLSLPLDKVG